MGCEIQKATPKVSVMDHEVVFLTPKTSQLGDEIWFRRPYDFFFFVT